MRKISKALFLCGIVVTLTACGQEVVSTENLERNINIDVNRAGNVDKSNIRKNEGEVSNQENSQEGGAFNFVYKGVALIPGELVDPSVLPECSNVAEVPSCAFDGNDKVYNFAAFELTAYFDENKEHIYSIYLIDSNLSTAEGLCFGDTVDDMKRIYGGNYETEGTAYIYTRGETTLNIITNNNVVTSMEYRLDK